MWHAKSIQNNSTQLRGACLEHDLEEENGQMRRRASHGVVDGSLHREPRKARLPLALVAQPCSRRLVHVLIRELDVSMERRRHRKPRDVLLRATRDITRTSSGSKVEQHKTQ